MYTPGGGRKQGGATQHEGGPAQGNSAPVRAAKGSATAEQGAFPHVHGRHALLDRCQCGTTATGTGLLCTHACGRGGRAGRLANRARGPPMHCCQAWLPCVHPGGAAVADRPAHSAAGAHLGDAAHPQLPQLALAVPRHHNALRPHVLARVGGAKQAWLHLRGAPRAPQASAHAAARSSTTGLARASNLRLLQNHVAHALCRAAGAQASTPHRCGQGPATHTARPAWHCPPVGRRPTRV